MKYLPYILVVVLLFTSYLQWNHGDKLVASAATEKQKVVEREDDIKALKIDKLILQAEKLKMQDDINNLNIEIAKSKAITLLIQKQRDEKVHSVDNIPSGQLQGYFTNRYGSGKAK